MDKVLAFSILSASPADIDISAAAGAGHASRWTRLSWRSPAAAFDRETGEQQQEKRDGSRGAHRGKERGARGGGGGAGAAGSLLPRFAPEFDGIDCFETIVSH